MRALDFEDAHTAHTQRARRYPLNRALRLRSDPHVLEPHHPILMFLSPIRNDEHYRPEDIQRLINSAASPNRSSPSAALPSDDMESGSASSSSSRVSTSDQRAAHCHSHRDEEEPAAASGGPGHGSGSLWSRYFSLPVLLLVGVTASLVILPLVLPPLPPPPSMLMLVPVAMLVMLLALAFMPTSSVRGGTGPTYM